MRARQEQAVAAFCHFSNAIPIWGLFFCGLVMFWFREQSRGVLRQARQAMVFHTLIMGALLLWCVVFQVIRLMRYLAPEAFCDALYWVNNGVMLCLYMAYAGLCFAGSARMLRGEPFRYPFLRGPR